MTLALGNITVFTRIYSICRYNLQHSIGWYDNFCVSYFQFIRLRSYNAGLQALSSM